ncbi:MAG: hypothetical protein Mars2KO_03130 [Maribacter sp.]
MLSMAGSYAQDWQPSYTEAITLAVERERPLILVFSGSDWCAPCIKLDKWIWQSDEFRSYAKENYVLYRADFPRKKDNGLSKELVAQNRSLADRFNPKGYFPLVVLLNGSEEVLGATGFKKVTPSEYITHLNTFIK